MIVNQGNVAFSTSRQETFLTLSIIWDASPSMSNKIFTLEQPTNWSFRMKRFGIKHLLTMLELCCYYIALTKLDFVDTSRFVFWVKLNFEMFTIFIASRSNWKSETKSTQNHKDTKSIHKNYNNTLKILESKLLGHCRRLGRKILDKYNSLIRCQIQPRLLSLEFFVQ